MIYEYEAPKIELSPSTNRYIHPIVPSEYHGIPVVVPVADDPRTHRGLFQGAVDFIVPVGTQVVAAHKGVVAEVKDRYEIYGDFEEYALSANLISVGHDNNEFSYYIHLGKGTAVVKPGDHVKPARLGSSIGITKAKTKKELEFALDVALHYDAKALVEEGVENLMDITVCVIGNENPVASLIQEAAFSKDFFSYEDKYLEGGGAQTGNAPQNLIIPAPLDEKTSNEIRDLAVEIYKKMGCSGISRVDFLYDKKTAKYYTTEINTLPGTLYAHLWKESGVELNDLLTKLIGYAIEKHESRKRITLTFESDILKMANSVKLSLKK